MCRLVQDLRYAVRVFVKSPGFTLVAVLIVALGIGANTAIFSVVESVLLKPLPYPEPGRLVSVWESRVDQGWTHASFSEANFWDINDLNHSFDAIGALRVSALNLTGFEFPERLSAGEVTTGFFRALRARPVVGRIFRQGEDQPAADTRVVLLSHRLWRSRFGGDPAVIHRSLMLDGERYAVVGVLPPGHEWLDAADVFVPLRRRSDAVRGSFEWSVVGRLHPGVTAEAAHADLESVCRQLSQLYPDIDRGMGITIGGSVDWVANETQRRALWILMGAVGLLLLVACVNLASLLLARATARTRELALRAALGADRVRLIRQTLTESILLSSAGAAVGLALAGALVRILRSIGATGIPRLDETRMDPWVLAFAVVLALLTGTFTGLVPALKTPQADLVAALREGERGAAGHRRTNRLRGALVTAEVAVSLVLLVGAGLLVRSFSAVLGTERGFQTSGRLALEISLPAPYRLVAATGAPPSASNPAQVSRGAEFIVEFLSRVQALPGVASAAAVNVRPLDEYSTGMGIGAATGAATRDGAVPWATWRMITRDYFRTMGLPLLKGRIFTEQDRVGRPWRVIVSKRVADLLWPGQDPIGQRAECWKGQQSQMAEVIGVVGDMRERGLTADPPLAVYLPYYGSGRSPIHFIVHAAASPQALVPMLRSTLANMDRNLPMFNVESLDATVASSVGSRRFTMLLLLAFAGVALLLALSGIYGVLAHVVARRTPEIGVRVALGASPRHVLRMVILQGMRPVAIGVGAGLAASFALSRFMAGMLFGVTPADAPTYAGVAAVLLLASVCSCYLPARQALRTDVVAALTKDQ